MKVEVILLALLGWIGAVDDDLEYNKAYPLPEIRYTTNAEMVKMYRPEADPKDHDLWGTYDHGENVIYLREGLDLKTKAGKAVLVHELVHYLQRMQGKWERVRCTAQLEPEAYVIENRYRDEHGLERWVSGFTIFLRGMCGGKGG